jgi:hypothetical protein
MTDPIDPMRPYGERRQQRRRAEDQLRSAGTGENSANLPAIIEGEEPRHADPLPPKADPAGEAAFAAQLYGQTGQRRGLRGGKPVLDAARSSYLQTEYSGPDDRRPSKGLLKKTDI